MIVACFGIHKSASTFAYRIACQMAKQMFDGEVSIGSDVATLNTAFLEEHSDYLDPDGKMLVQKTHAGTNIDLTEMGKAGKIKAIVSVRDLRDVALSMLDAGEQERAADKKNQMSRIYTIDDAVKQIKKDVDALEVWASQMDPLYISYVEIKEEPEKVAGNISEFIFGKELSDEQRKEITESVPKNSIRLNKGIHQRFLTDMSEEHSELIKEQFADFYAQFGALV